MKILHIPFGFHPDPVGGTEIYVEQLAHSLRGLGVAGVVAAPATEAADYTHQGLPVRRFAVGPTDLDALYGGGDPVAAAGLARILDAERPDVVHLHSFTSATSAHALARIRERGLPLVYTYHLPGASCQRGTLLRWGEEPCDGVLDVGRCAGCTLHSLGVGRAGSALLGGLPPAAGRMLGRAGVSGGPWTALRMSELIRRRHEAVRTLLAAANVVVALCEWTRALLLRNGVEPAKVALSRHGISWDGPGHPAEPGAGGPLRVAFLGRRGPVKGDAVLLQALSRAPGADIRLDMYSIVQGQGHEDYTRQIEGLAGEDPRVRLLPAVPNSEVVGLLRGYDLLAVPSQWFETGPLVVLEAFAAGVPVLGSDLGGVAELVTHEQDGMLVPARSVEAWAAALGRLAADRALLGRLRAGVRPPRRAADVATDMAGIYSRLLSQR